MRMIKTTVVVAAMLTVTGCATMDEASNSLSCMLARATGKACGGQEAAMASTGQGGRFEQLQTVFEQEIQTAREAQARAVAATQPLGPKQRAVAGEVAVIHVDITDSRSQQKRNMRTLDAMTLDMPLGGKGKDGYTQAMDEIKDLANTLADNRGSASILVQQNPADVKAKRVNTASGNTKSPAGQPIAVEKQTTANVPAGVERYTVKAGAIRGSL